MTKTGNIEKSRSVPRRAFLGETGITLREEQQRLQNIEDYLKVFLGYDPDSPDPRKAAIKDSLFLFQQFQQLRGDSVISDPPIEEKGRFHEELEAVVAAAEALFAGFGDLMTRCARHTDLCAALRVLRTEAKDKPRDSFFRVIVDIHDCVRFTRPEDMTKKMAKVIGNVVPNLSDSMTKEELFSITDKLFDAGLRPWSPPREGTGKD